MPDDLEHLYQDAKSAFRGKEYDRASELFKQILLIDENYKDTSRLLAQSVRLKRRRWYNDPRLWGALGVAALIGLGIWLAQVLPLTALFRPLGPTIGPTVTVIPSITPTLTPTPVPLVWKRISMGQDFARDEITSIVQDPKDTEVLFIGTNQAGIFKSIDGGLSWRPMSMGLNSAHISSLLVSPIDHNTVFAYTGSGLYVSTNGGADWQLVGERVFSSEGFVAADSQGNIYCVWGSSNIRKSEDGGHTWVDAGSTPELIRAFVISPINPDTFYAVDWEKLYRSRDAGKSWASINPDWTNTYIESMDISATGRYVYATSGGFPYAPPSHVLDTASGQWTETQFPAGCSIFADPLADEVAYCGVEKSIFKTSDTGKSWQLLGNLDVGAVKEILISANDPGKMYGGGQGFFVSSDGGRNWTQNNSGLPGIFLEFKIDPKSSSTLYTQDILFGMPIYRSTDSGKTWKAFHTSSCNLTFDADGSLLCFTYSGSNRSFDGGASWIGINISRKTNIVAANPFGSRTMLATSIEDDAVLFVSEDNGYTWKQARFHHEANGSWNLRFFFDHNQGQVIYAADREIDRSSDGGYTWQACGPTPEIAITDTRLAIDHRDSNYLILASQGEGILISMDGCATWRPSNSGLDSLFVNTVAIDPNNSDTVYAGTDGGAYVSFNRGQTWGEISDGRPWNEINDGLLGALVIYSIAVDKDSNVYAATPYGIFRLEGK